MFQKHVLYLHPHANTHMSGQRGGFAVKDYIAWGVVVYPCTEYYRCNNDGPWSTASAGRLWKVACLEGPVGWQYLLLAPPLVDMKLHHQVDHPWLVSSYSTMGGLVLQLDLPLFPSLHQPFSPGKLRNFRNLGCEVAKLVDGNGEYWRISSFFNDSTTS